MIAEWLVRLDPWWGVMLRQMLYATILFAIVTLLVRCRAERSPRWLYLLWGLVIWRLILPVDLASPVALATLARDWLAPTAASVVSSAAMEPVSSVVLDEASAVTIAPSPKGWPTIVLGVWLAAAFAFGSRVLARRRPYVDLARRADGLDGSVARCLVDRWRRRYGIRRPVRLVAADGAIDGRPVGPFTVGTWRPIVFVPSWIARRPQLLEATLAHELAHVRRFDDLRLIFQESVRTIWVLFPLVHVAIARLRRERERLCDRLATAPGHLSRRRYAAALRTILAGGSEPARAVPGMASATGGMFPERNRTMRFDSLLREPRRASLVGGATYLALIVLVLPMAPMVTSAPATAAEPPAAPSPAAPSAVDGSAVLAGMINPLPDQRVTSPFGPRNDPFGRDLRTHTGIDLKGHTGLPFKAPADGVVELATERWEGHEDWGTVIVLDHGGGVRTLYAHLDSFAVEEGEAVRRGEVIGATGSTGKSTAPHLHFEIHRDGEPIDPASVIGDWR
ncbi:MAG: peptidoglycan DD-metalloendopeptidase family protein [Acidobacteriota bacterium]